MNDPAYASSAEKSGGASGGIGMTEAVEGAASSGTYQTPPSPPISTDSGSRSSSKPEEARKKLLKVEIRTPAVFKNVLLRSLPWDGVSGYPLNRHHLNDDVPIMVHNGKTYHLRPGYAVLMHNTPPGQKGASTWFTQLFYHQRLRPNDKERPSPFCHADRASGDFFLPLGSFIEAANDVGEKRATNYCWALNISTDPVSLWLVFDYVMVSPRGKDTTIKLSEVYLNEYNEEFNYGYAFEKAPQGYLGLGSAWDVLKVFDDVDKDWQPENPRVPELDGAAKWHLGSTMRAYPLDKPAQSPQRLRYFEQAEEEA
ncbi:MAG: hypothetical protein LQ346_005483 [Caloplaca aetnensis]|nr:MAG: hypothetical protein LQ346_005483 [Caloplaca aetnensis]